MTILVTNAFSINMIADLTKASSVSWQTLSKEEFSQELRSSDWESCVGHQSTADVYSEELGIDIPMNRVTVALNPGDVLLVGQYQGPRLEEGATQLPQGSEIIYLKVVIS